ncbi:serine hydrolase domain-containing protein [Kineosporia babensis]
MVTSGVAGQRSRREMPEQGHFRIASTRKAMVAVVVLQLVAEGKLGLDEKVEKYLPGTTDRITVRHLLQNTSGLHDDLPGYTTAQEYLEQRYDVHTREELIARTMQHPLDFAPGTSWSYSNTGYLLLDAIVEKVTRKPLYRSIEQRIAGPLGLRTLGPAGTSPLLPTPHSRAHQQFEVGSLVDVTEQVSSDPDGVLATTRDLTRFFRALLGGQLLPPAQLNVMRQDVPVSPELAAFWPDARYGLGLVSRPLRCGGRYWGHDGGDGGFITVTGVTENGRSSAVVTMNTALAATPEGVLNQQRAADRLVQRALCS